MDEAEQLCDRLVIMDRARIVTEGSPRELIARHVPAKWWSSASGAQNGDVADELAGIGTRIEALPDRVVIGTDDGDSALNEIHARGIHPESSLVRRSTLEDVFLALTGRSLVE